MRFLYAVLGMLLFFVVLILILSKEVLLNLDITHGEVIMAMAIVFAGGMAGGGNA